MNQIQEWLDLVMIPEVDYLQKLLSSFLIILILWVIRFFILKIVHHQTESPNNRYSWRKGTSYLFFFLTIILVGRHWLNGLEPILAFLGIIAVGLTISLKEIVLNMASMIVIMWRNTFVVGDRIQISDYKGDVVGLGVMYFSLLEIGQWVDAEQSTGRLIKVPNGLVLTQAIINYTRSFPYIWDEISLVVTLSSNWKKAREILQTIANERTEDYSQQMDSFSHQLEDEQITFHQLGPKVYIKPTSTSTTGIQLTLRYLCLPRKRRDKENEIWEEIFDQFARHSDITIV